MIIEAKDHNVSLKPAIMHAKLAAHTTPTRAPSVSEQDFIREYSSGVIIINMCVSVGKITHLLIKLQRKRQCTEIKKHKWQPDTPARNKRYARAADYTVS